LLCAADQFELDDLRRACWNFFVEYCWNRESLDAWRKWHVNTTITKLVRDLFRG
ncbi:hypothetical protein ScPMuIL_007339, partial [Solemya velum]